MLSYLKIVACLKQRHNGAKRPENKLTTANIQDADAILAVCGSIQLYLDENVLLKGHLIFYPFLISDTVTNS